MISGYGDTMFTNDMENIQSMKIHGCQNIVINSQRMGSLEVSLNPKLLYLRASSLTTLGPFVDYVTSPKLPGTPPALNDALLIAENPTLESVDFPALTTIDGSVQIMENEHLQELGTSPGGNIVGLWRGFPVLQGVTDDVLIQGDIEA